MYIMQHLLAKHAAITFDRNYQNSHYSSALQMTHGTSAKSNHCQHICTATTISIMPLHQLLDTITMSAYLNNKGKQFNCEMGQPSVL